MKHYIIALMPELSAQKSIEDLRTHHTGTILIDELPPHVTFKSRSALREGVTEDDLIKIFETIDMHEVSIVFDEAEILGGAFVLRGVSDQVKEMHRKIRTLLADSVVDIRPEFEGDHYKIHLTLWRGATSDVKADSYLGEMRFDRMCLYEIDPTLDRAYAHKIVCKKLESEEGK